MKKFNAPIWLVPTEPGRASWLLNRVTTKKKSGKIQTQSSQIAGITGSCGNYNLSLTTY